MNHNQQEQQVDKEHQATRTTHPTKDHDAPAPHTTRFACKICRTILFHDCDIEDPPHTKSKHSFSSRKTKSGSNVNLSRDDECQNIFLADSLDWMGPITESHEGKLSCPKCNGKLGMYKWHGTQCSCGTWVVPAIMIHKSRVDVISPLEQDISPTTFPLTQFHPSIHMEIGQEIS
jgi:dual specificity phosphatase 12